ncbi:aldehyde dehydrogenase family protein [Nocardia wallacei]|uniref:aldehyde dehydrogenase family protein n=1 Tax=Nocardia wallacei TaxID=480035 RepID=UPI0024568AD9|nr:aldehyde dehydrogenase family protein [Nocardia wallacei]
MTLTVPEISPSIRTFLKRATRSIIIDGDGWFASLGGEIETRDPATNQRLTAIASGTSVDVDAAVRSANEALPVWQGLTAAARGRMLATLGQLIEDNAEELAIIETLDNGKPINESQYLDIHLTSSCWTYYAGWTTKLTGQTIPVSPPIGDAFVYTRREPLGVVGAIVPWNFPLLIASWKLAPALAAGNTVVLKPSEVTSLTAIRLAELALDAGFPPGVLNVVTGYGAEAGQSLIDHPGVAKISFTGSTETGRQIVVASAAHLKKLTLELGGKSANIVFPDADLSAAAMGAVTAIYTNQGQVCCAGSRLFVHEDIHDEVVSQIEAFAREIHLGHGLDETTDMGPLVSATQLARVEGYVESGLSEGATLVCGGSRPGGEVYAGHFLKPTMFTNVRDEMRIAREEIFGPVLSVSTFRDEHEVVARANKSHFGLAAGVWTSDLKRAHRVAHRLEAGTVWQNMYNMLDAAAPFGGYKQSGYGRDLGEEALLGYTQTKSVWVGLD